MHDPDKRLTTEIASQQAPGSDACPLSDTRRPR